MSVPERIIPATIKGHSRMTGARAIRNRVYRVYLEFLETAEKKRRWNIFDDVPWDGLEVFATPKN
jgi:hypothetical protein